MAERVAVLSMMIEVRRPSGQIKSSDRIEGEISLAIYLNELEIYGFSMMRGPRNRGACSTQTMAAAGRQRCASGSIAQPLQGATTDVRPSVIGNRWNTGGDVFADGEAQSKPLNITQDQTRKSTPSTTCLGPYFEESLTNLWAHPIDGPMHFFEAQAM
ncbi:hypothetical protein L484_007801 [Morus notabilis]|uniref:Uncharacterized protein n=1 Tax=Morus notabilis TaxID=981085 RepID=W9RMH9_9ROSA|nr:hypothetical protein L484_007801 [Morus notabilis]